MKLFEDLANLKKAQATTDDGYRLYCDGSIKTATVTDSLELGWYCLASPIPGAFNMFRTYFKCEFLKTEGMRESIALRDKMFEVAIESRLRRINEMSLTNA